MGTGTSQDPVFPARPSRGSEPVPIVSRSLSILIVGPADSDECRLALDELDEAGDTAAGETAAAKAWATCRAADVDPATVAIAAGQCEPDVIVIVQAYPGQIAAEAVERLRRLCPLARLVGLLGTWCEGEPRTGRPWPGVMRCYWHQWPVHGRRQLEALAAAEPTPLALPPTATEEERILAAARAGRPPVRRGAAVILAHYRPMAMLLEAVCRGCGLSPSWTRGVPSTEAAPALALFDADELCPATLDELRRFAAAVEPAPLGVLASFPRIAGVLAALEAGASAVFAKPVDMNDLEAWIEGIGD